MPIQIKWRETASRVTDLDHLAALAKALDESDNKDCVLCFFEFANPQEVIEFCKAWKWMQSLRDIKRLEDRKAELEKAIKALEEEKERPKVVAVSE